MSDRQIRLPTFPTPFIGRAAEIAEISQLLDNPDCRLLTLVGPGGMGKTRLAVEVARARLDDFSDGVYFVPLQSLTNAGDMPAAVADALGIHLDSDTDIQSQILDYLTDRSLLLVMDNFEHVLDSAAFVAAIVQRVPEVKIVATSREPLNLQAEWLRQIQGMRFPPSSTEMPLDDYSAVQLFAERARRMQADFDLAIEASAVIRICQQVDGMPLGIELAAAWLRTMTCEQIADEIQRNLDFLTTQTRDMPDRHRSIRAVFDYSWTLLSEPEQTAFRRLAVFQSGFSREAAESIAGASLLMLTSLVDKSLIAPGDDGRYEIHTLLRHYAHEKLAEAGEVDATDDAHCAWFAHFMTARAIDIKGRRQLAGLNEIEADVDNLRTAWQRALEHRQYDRIEQMIEGFFWFRNYRGRYNDVFQQAWQHIAPSPTETPHPVAMKVLVRLREFRLAPQADIERGLEVARQCDDQAEVAFCTLLLAYAFHDLVNDSARAILVIEKRLSEYRDVDEPFYVAFMWQVLGDATNRVGQHDKAADYIHQSLELSQTIGNRINEAWCLIDVAMAQRGMLHLLEEARNIFQEMRVPAGEALTLSKLSWMVWRQDDDITRATALVQQALDIALSVNYLHGIADALAKLSLLASVEENYASAWQLAQQSLPYGTNTTYEDYVNFAACLATCGLENYAAARRYYQAMLNKGVVDLVIAAILLAGDEHKNERAVEILGMAAADPDETSFWERWPIFVRLCQHLETELGSAVFAEAWERGENFDGEAVAQEIAAHFLGLPVEHQEANQSLSEPLSQRELEVLQLIAAGLSNREVAEKLVLSLSTVKVHTRNIYGKLGVNSRTQAVAEARRLYIL